MLNLLDAAFKTYDDVNNSEMRKKKEEGNCKNMIKQTVSIFLGSIFFVEHSRARQTDVRIFP